MDLLDYIVVGQGIAGSNLAFELLRRGRKIAIVDDSHNAAACLVAAGVVNPITGQRLVKSWRSDVAHPYAKGFYLALEKSLSAEFFHDRKILQLCKSPEEHGLWLDRIKNPAYAEFIGEGSTRPEFADLNDRFGHHFIERSAWVETAPIIDAYTKFFDAKKILLREKFDCAKLSVSAQCAEYRGLRARAVIFCEGWRAIRNPYFSWLPYRCAKGEILELKHSNKIDMPEHIIHRGNWVMKCAPDTFRIGSTWDRENLDTAPTESARAELLRAAKTIVPNAGELTLVRHSAGVRPCTATTRPHLGRHPTMQNLYSFNGFGSKGYALTPYFAKHFADYLDGLTPLDPEADISRHVRRFFR